jgi:hypothetical protein
MDEFGGRADATFVENNWLQSLEGDIDLPHIPYLHAGNLESFRQILVSDAASSTPRVRPDPMEIFAVADSPAGFAFAGAPPVRNNMRTWSIGHFMFPFFANLPYGMLSSHWAVARVPMDDHHTMTFGMWNRNAALAPRELMFGEQPAYLANTSDWFGRFRLTRNLANDFQIDRNARPGASGISGQASEDIAVTGSQGPILDRTREHLCEADVAIIHLRRRLLAALRTLDEQGAPAATSPDAYLVKHGTFRIAKDLPWDEELRRRGGMGPAV